MSSWRISVKAVPNASRDEICGWLGDELKIRVASPPSGGQANRRICTLLSSLLAIPASHIRVVSGSSSPRKVLEISQGDARQIDALFPRNSGTPSAQ